MQVRCIEWVRSVCDGAKEGGPPLLEGEVRLMS